VELAPVRRSLYAAIVLAVSMVMAAPVHAQASLSPDLARHFTLEPPGVFKHRETGFEFPPAMDTIARSGMHILAPDGTDVSASYSATTSDKKYTAQLFLFKPNLSVKCQGLAEARACQANTNSNTIIFSEGPYAPKNRPDLRGFKGIYRGKIGAGGEATILHYFDLGAWTVKLFTIIQSTDGKSTISVDDLKIADRLIDTLAWDKLVKSGAGCPGKACDLASAFPLQDHALASIVRMATIAESEKAKSEKQLLSEMAPVAEVTPILSLPIKLFAPPMPDAAALKTKDGKKKISYIVYRAATAIGELRLNALALDDLQKLTADLPSHMSWKGPITYLSLHGPEGPLPMKLFDGLPSQSSMEETIKGFMLEEIKAVSGFPLLKDYLQTPPPPQN
jgi:hypothetical protein